MAGSGTTHLRPPGEALLRVEHLTVEFPVGRSGLRVHAPGAVRRINDDPGEVGFSVATWSPRPGWVLINGLKAPTEVLLQGAPASLSAPHLYQDDAGRLILQVTGTTDVTLRPAR